MNVESHILGFSRSLYELIVVHDQPQMPSKARLKQQLKRKGLNPGTCSKHRVSVRGSAAPPSTVGKAVLRVLERVPTSAAVERDNAEPPHAYTERQ